MICGMIGLQALKRLQPCQIAIRGSQMSKPILTQAEVKTRLHYDPATGVFTWRKGGVAGYCEGRYRAIWFNGTGYKVHRLAWLYMTGDWPKDELDHINRDRYDNRWANLREADRFLNCQNAGTRSDNTSGVRGVSFKSGKWRARINVNRKERHLGAFDDFDDAVTARKQAEIELDYGN